MEMTTRNKALGAWIGLAIGDALGAPAEFKPRDSYPEIRDMIGGGPFDLPPGYWTDDTSMALCLAENLLANSDKNYIDQEDLLNRFYSWYVTGENSSTGKCFDIGIQTLSVLSTWALTREVNEDYYQNRSGNGAIMRLAPAVISSRNYSEAISKSREQGNTTHPSYECRSCGSFMTLMMYNAINSDYNKLGIINLTKTSFIEVPIINKVFDIDKPRDQIKSTGYVVDTLNAAIWCFKHTASFEEALIAAVNLGDDTDTVGAVTGQLAGAYYGLSNIPDRWIEKLYDYNRLLEIGKKLIRLSEDSYS